jgi:hypothetical protein
MRDINIEFPPHLQKLVDLGESGTNIMHGHLKNLMYETEVNMLAAQNNEPLNEDEYDPSDDYFMGRMDALTEIYAMTYNLAFAINDRSKQNG